MIGPPKGIRERGIYLKCGGSRGTPQAGGAPFQPVPAVHHEGAAGGNGPAGATAGGVAIGKAGGDAAPPPLLGGDRKLR